MMDFCEKPEKWTISSIEGKFHFVSISVDNAKTIGAVVTNIQSGNGQGFLRVSSKFTQSLTMHYCR